MVTFNKSLRLQMIVCYSMVHGQEEGQYILRIGSLTLHSVGQLLPHQLQTGKFHTRDCIYPVSPL